MQKCTKHSATWPFKNAFVFLMGWVKVVPCRLWSIQTSVMVTLNQGGIKTLHNQKLVFLSRMKIGYQPLSNFHFLTFLAGGENKFWVQYIKFEFEKITFLETEDFLKNLIYTEISNLKVK